MRVSIVAGLIVAVHVAVIGSVVMTQGCATTARDAHVATPLPAEAPPPPVLPPSAPVVAHPVVFPPIQPPVAPAPVRTDVAVENVYVVKAGDMLSKIASAHGVNARELAELNQITDPNRIRVGQRLILPDHAQASKSPPAAPAAVRPAPTAPAAPKPVAAGESYVVKAGDSLSKIAVAHGVTIQDLMSLNQITDPNRIRIGQKISIPERGKPKADAPKPEKEPETEKKPEAAPAPAVAAPAPAPAPAVDDEGLFDLDQEPMLDYTVQAGDTLESIARLFVVRQDDIRRVNNIPAGTDVNPGQRIKIPPTSL